MTTALPTILAAYFAATDRHDVPTMVALFSDTAVVKDEGKEHRGLDAIRKWAEEAIRQYDFTVEPIGVTEAAGRTVVTGTVSGTFPGSPLQLKHAFSFDHEKISRLEIG
jgi:ketosteroid isomerase-like protein